MEETQLLRALIYIVILMLFSLSVYANNESSKSSIENTKSNIIIFVSFSMPKESIKTWMQEASKIGASVVMRGLVNNSFKETISATYDLIKDNQAQGIAIDPTLFKKFNIDKVPAVVVVNSLENYDVVFGDVTLDYAFDVIANRGEVGKNQVQKEIEKLRGKHD